jgi:formylmethanofuran dehydrogenase subunit E
MKIFCEHCGELDTKTKQYTIDGIDWCVWCAYAGDHITEEEFRDELKKEKKK